MTRALAVLGCFPRWRADTGFFTRLSAASPGDQMHYEFNLVKSQ
jgi:hypothetical protein